MIWRLASKQILKFLPFYIHLVLEVVVYLDFSPFLQESLEVTDQRKELIVDLRTAYVCFSMWLLTHQQPSPGTYMAWPRLLDVVDVCCQFLAHEWGIIVYRFCTFVARSLSKTPHQQEYKVLYWPAGLSLRGFPLITQSITTSYCGTSIQRRPRDSLAEFVCFNEVSLYQSSFSCILQLLGPRMLFVIGRSLLGRGSLYWGYTVVP